jgi:UDP-sugar transporter A1/2/3
MCGLPIKYLSLLVLVIQNSTLVLIMSYSRTVPGPMYIASTAVFWMEVIKVTCCLLLLRLEKRSTHSFIRALNLGLIGDPYEGLKMIIPAFLYAIQNNLLYTALSNLEAATFQVSYQLKILTTALFSVVMLGKSLSPLKWFALVLLMLGLTLVQLQTVTISRPDPEDPSTASAGPEMPASRPPHRAGRRLLASPSHPDSSESPSRPLAQNGLLGLGAVFAACLSSGFAGVYFEVTLKKSKTGLWMRNIQLGLFGMMFSFMTMMFTDGVQIMEKGMFHGYNIITWMVVFNQALGGLLVAIVVKYADNILKGFATSVSIVLSSIISFYLFNFQPSFQFVVGTSIVILAVYIYSINDTTTMTKPKQGR